MKQNKTIDFLRKNIEGMYKRIYRKDEIQYKMSVLSSCLDIPN